MPRTSCRVLRIGGAKIRSEAAEGQHYNYVATFTDPTVYTRPWTATIPARRYTVADRTDDWHYEVSIVEVGARWPTTGADLRGE